MGEHKKPRIIRKETVRQGKFLRFVRVTYADSSGIQRDWEYFERVNCKGIVVMVPFTDSNELLLIRQFRPPLGGYVIEFPAGLNDKGDTLEEAARRELVEETGYSAGEMVFLTEGPVSSGASGEILTAFLARGLTFQGIGERDETEDIDVIKVPLGEIETTLSSLRSGGNYVDLKIYGLIDLAKRHLTF